MIVDACRMPFVRASRVKDVVANMIESVRLNANQHLVAAIPVRELSNRTAMVSYLGPSA